MLAYFAVNLGIFLVNIDMERNIEFKQAIKHRGRLYSNMDYIILALFGGPIYLFALIKSIYDRA
jgi:hypothetical protein